MIMWHWYPYSDIPRVYFVENATGNELRCHGESITNLSNITIFDDNGDPVGKTVISIRRLNYHLTILYCVE